MDSAVVVLRCPANKADITSSLQSSRLVGHILRDCLHNLSDFGIPTLRSNMSLLQPYFVRRGAQLCCTSAMPGSGSVGERCDMSGLYAYFKSAGDHRPRKRRDGLHRFFGNGATASSSNDQTQEQQIIPQGATVQDAVMVVSSDSEVEYLPSTFPRERQHAGHPPVAGTYNVHVGQYMLPVLQLPRQLVAEHAAKIMARSCFEQGHATWLQIAAIMSALPDEQKRRWRQSENSSMAPAKSFMTGAWSRGPHAGLTRNLRSYPMVSRLLANIIRSVDPTFSFSSCTLARNVCSKPHTDCHNAPGSWNLVVPCSSYTGGELWVQHGEGTISLSPQGASGFLWDTTTPVRFDPRMQHATAPWTGDRVILIGYHVRHMSKLSEDDAAMLSKMGFKIGTDFA